LTRTVNRDLPVLPVTFEFALRTMRVGLHELSDNRFPGLRTRHYRLLGFIPADGIRLSRIAALSGLTKQALAQAMVPLEQGSYVDVVADPTDRRARIVRRTARGHEVLEALLAMQADYERQWSARVGADRWTAAREVLVELFLQ
jgi:DNA-binding MarR family transcriptional regulator